MMGGLFLSLRMASVFMGCYYKVFLILILFFSSLQFNVVTCSEFEVGGDDGWIVPKSKNEGQMYNKWASENRFKVDDTVHLKYKKASIMAVTEEEYEKCRSSHPIFFSNNGYTVFKLDRPGLFYFISGATGHCEGGQKMAIKVLELETPPQSGNENTTDSLKKNKMLQLKWLKFPLQLPCFS